MNQCTNCEIYQRRLYRVSCDGNKGQTECIANLQTVVSNMKASIEQRNGSSFAIHFIVPPDSRWKDHRFINRYGFIFEGVHYLWLYRVPREPNPLNNKIMEDLIPITEAEYKAAEAKYMAWKYPGDTK